MSNAGWVPVALVCGHVLMGQAMYEMPAVGSGEPERVECPDGCGMVEFVLPPDFQGRARGPFVEHDLGYVAGGTDVEIDLDGCA
jgi:hypothetical protein